MPAATCAPIPAASPGAWRWRRQRSRERSTSRRCRELSASTRTLTPPTPALLPSRCAAGVSTARLSWPTTRRSRARSTRMASHWGGIALARLKANARLINGSGQIGAAFAGSRGANFAFSTVANVTPDTIRLTGSGQVGGRPLVLRQPAVLTHSGDGWALAPTMLSFAGGSATLSGRSGSHPKSMRNLRRCRWRFSTSSGRDWPVGLGDRAARLCVGRTARTATSTSRCGA